MMSPSLAIELALARKARLAGHGGLAAGRRHVPDDEELLDHRPDVRGEPVEHDAEREGEAGEGEDEREEVEQDALLRNIGLAFISGDMFFDMICSCVMNCDAVMSTTIDGGDRS